MSRKNTRIFSRFEYFAEDMHCLDCLYYKKKSKRKNPKSGCGEEMCRYIDLLVEALIAGRIKRKRGYFRIWDESPGSR